MSIGYRTTTAGRRTLPAQGAIIAAETDDADTICRSNPKLDNGTEDRDPSAEEWAGAG